MAAVLADSNVILDVATDDPTSTSWSAEALGRAADALMTSLGEHEWRVTHS